jgi:cell wall-associated NlpC family hydrolase
MDVETLRAAVVAEALSWCGTPFHDCSGVKGHGTDCVHLLIGVYSRVGLIRAFEPKYKPQWFQHRAEPRFLDGLAAHGARRIDAAAALAGDVLMYNYGHHAAHSGIVVDSTTIVHAYKPVKMVTRGDRREFEHRLDSAWTLFPEGT